MKELRLKTGLEQKDFGAYCGGIPEYTIKRWENKFRNPKPYVKKLIEFRIEHSDRFLINTDKIMSVREIRELTKLTQTQFAYDNQIPIRTLEDWENNRRVPPIYINRLLAFKYGGKK